MEYREGRCPKCNEVMQIPVGREKIICMFCGQEFSVEEGKKADAAAYEEGLSALQERIGSLFVEIEKTVKGFQRTEYEASFEKYLIKHQDVLQMIRKIMSGAPDATDAAEKISDMLVAQGESLMSTYAGKLNYKSEQMKLNMYMVTFVIPSILSIENGKCSAITDLVCAKWAATFKDSKIQAADFATLSSGFRKKLCYITTAVCRGLHKPEDCYELNLLKQYRDGYLASAEGGEETIGQYYDMAPTIVKRVEKRENKEEIYRYLYDAYISPCIHFIEDGRNQECREKYREMVEMLQAEYMQS